MAGTLVASNINDGTSTGNTTDMIKGLARALVNFNGVGTVAIRAAYNVSSITDNGTGNYTVNFATPMPDANYCTNCVGTGEGVNTNDLKISWDSTYTTYSVKVIHIGDTYTDVSRACVSIFR